MIPLPPALSALASLLPAPLYVVGGYVRNALLWGAPRSTDIDVCGAMTVAEIESALRGTAASIIPVNPRVGTVLIRYEGRDFEYTTFRRDSYPIGGVHTPQDVVFVGTVEEDAGRRDFRVNALYLDVASGRVLDPTGGMEDLHRGVIATTRTPAEVFAEDGLRILRMVRFCAELGFVPGAETLEVAKAMRAQLADISPERKREELDKILLSDTKYGIAGAETAGVALVSRMGLWPYLLGEEQTTVRLAGYPPVLSVRLAALVMQLATGDAVEFAVRTLGKEGLRYANRTVNEICMLLRGYEAPETTEGWYLWAARYGEAVERIVALWQDETRRETARAAIAAIREAGVPLTHKDLPLTPAEFEALGVPKEALGKVMKQVVDGCIARLMRPTKAQCIQIVKQLQGGTKWN